MIKNRFHGLLKKKFTPSLGVLLGSLIMAAGMNLFLIPHRLAAGGISGLGVIFFHLFRIPAGLTIAVLNLPLFIAAWFILARPQVARLKELIYELDPAAFVIIGNAGEVHGEGFREMKGSH